MSCQGKPQWEPGKEPYFQPEINESNLAMRDLSIHDNKFYGYVMHPNHMVYHPEFELPSHVNVIALNRYSRSNNRKIPLICFTFVGNTPNELLSGATEILEMLANQQIKDLEAQIDGLRNALK